MIYEDKQLLLKDLSARLPYKVIIRSVGENKIISLWDLRDIDNLPLPYLRPMSSMTEEERNEYLSIKMQETERVALTEVYRPEAISEIMDWLNKRHFDYRGLIEKGLALEAPEGMYK